MSGEKTAKKAKATKAAGTVVYTGPAIPGIVSKNAIFNNGLPEALEKEIAGQPVIGALVVPIGELGRHRRELRDKGSAAAACYARAEAHLKGE